MWETVFPFRNASLVPASATVYLLAGIAIGGIGLVSSVPAVAGGELLTPTLIFIFGKDIRIAGSASILISLGIELMGLWRYRGRIPNFALFLAQTIDIVCSGGVGLSTGWA